MKCNSVVWAGVMVAAILAGGPGQGRAETRTWTGDTDDGWFTSGNWSPGGLPAVDDELTINAGAANQPNAGGATVTTDNGGRIDFLGGDSTFGDLVIGADGAVALLGGSVTATNVDASSGGAFTSSGNTMLTVNGGNLSIGGASDTLLSGSYEGTGGLLKTGTGVLTLGASNSFDGDVLVDGGTLVIGQGDTLGGNAVTVTNGATLRIEGNGEDFGSLAGGGDVVLSQRMGVGFNDSDSTFSGTITGAGDLSKEGNGTWVFSGTADHTGQTRASNGRLVVDGAATSIGATSRVLLLGGDMTVRGGASVTTDEFDIISFVSSLSFEGGVVMLTGAGSTSDLSAQPTVAIGSVGPGTLHLTNSTTARFTNLAITGSDDELIIDSGSTLVIHDTLTLGGDADRVIDGTITGNGGLIKTGLGRLSLRGNNLYAGSTRIEAGTFSVGANDPLSDTTAVTVLAGATLEITGNGEGWGSLAGAGQVVDRSTGGIGFGANDQSTTFSGTITGDGRVVRKLGAGTMVLTGVNPYTNRTVVHEGLLSVDGPGASITDTESVEIFGGAALRIDNGGSVTTGSVFGDGALELANGVLQVTGPDGLAIGQDDGEPLTPVGTDLVLGDQQALQVTHTTTVDNGSLTLAGGSFFTGGLTLEPTARVTFQLTPPTAAPGIDPSVVPVGSQGGNHNEIVVTGVAMLDGTLEIQRVNDFAPVHGEALTILTAQEVVGSFSGFTGDVFTIESDLAWVPVVDEGEDTVAIVVTAPGDADLDFKVDAADLNTLALNWQQNVAGWSSGDFNNDGFIDAADLNLLAINWQAGASGVGGVDGPALVSFERAWLAAFANLPGAVPEPGAASTLLIGGWMIFSRRTHTVPRL